jgi:serine phosphatase RsbU (regulator of sigma subunit)/ligand-binding sensor domain-containing protein
MKKLLPFLFLWFFSILPTQAQIPLLHNYTSDNAPEFEVCFHIFQDNRGLMYFGVRDGLYTFDGTTWKENKSVNSMARAITQDEHGTIFIGTHKGIGYLERLPTGEERFISLADQLTEEEKKLPTIWHMVNVKEGGILARAQRFTFHFKKVGNQYKKIKSYPAFGDAILSFQVHGKFYATEGEEESEKVKLFIYENGEKKELLENAILQDVHAILPWKNNQLLFVGRSSGFWVFDKTTRKITNWQTHPQDKKLRDAAVYEYSPLRNGGFALATNVSGILVFSKEAELLYQIDEANGLQGFNVHTLYEDRQGNLWAGVGKGISKIMLSLPFELYNKYQGIKDNVYDVLLHENTLYLATNSGVLYWENGKFNLIEGTLSQCWNLFPYDKGIMVGGGNRGAFYIENKKLVHYLTATNSVMRLVPSKRDNTIFYATTYGGLRIFKFTNRQFTDLGLIKATETDCRSAVELPDGRVWVGTTSKGVFLVSFPEGFSSPEAVGKAVVKNYTKGLKEVERNRVFENTTGVFFTSPKGLYQFNEKTETFELYQGFPIDYTLPAYQTPFFRQDSDGNTWLLNSRVILRKKEGGMLIDSLSLLPVRKGISSFYETTNKLFYLANVEGVFRYDAQRALPTTEIATFIRSVSFSANDSLLNLQGNIIIPYHLNALVFKFACLNFWEEKENQFQYKLDNYDTHWSAWTKLSLKEYTNLREGSYTFRVRGKNIYGHFTKEITYSFTILPPWYRTWWAYLLYILLGSLIVWALVIANTRRLRLQKRRLSLLVKERTAELELRNVELEQQKEEIITIAENLRQANNEITLQHKNITASINYAKRIQKAILPFDERISQSLNEYFVFYQPRDIVSGDFYFFQSWDDSFLLATVDCTGHGVPGAFMSMIGYALLNDIIGKNDITQPNLVLGELHKGIQHSLKQKETQNNDGMDIGILVVHKATQEIHFAGARNNLIYFENNELKQIKGDKLLIGGEQREMERIFSCTVVSYTGKITLYLSSDGFHDQFGGAEGKKYSTPRFKDFLHSLHKYPMSEQKKLVEQEFTNWKGRLAQTDDVMLIGVRV